MQPSARKINGQKVFALIGPEGTKQAYIEVPAGLDTSPLLSRRVGVRGEIQYSDSLKARLVTVRDLDPLEWGRRANRQLRRLLSSTLYGSVGIAYRVEQAIEL